eukprot:284815370_5
MPSWRGSCSYSEKSTSDSLLLAGLPSIIYQVWFREQLLSKKERKTQFMSGGIPRYLKVLRHCENIRGIGTLVTASADPQRHLQPQHLFVQYLAQQAGASTLSQKRLLPPALRLLFFLFSAQTRFHMGLDCRTPLRGTRDLTKLLRLTQFDPTGDKMRGARPKENDYMSSPLALSTLHLRRPVEYLQKMWQIPAHCDMQASRNHTLKKLKGTTNTVLTHRSRADNVIQIWPSFRWASSTAAAIVKADCPSIRNSTINKFKTIAVGPV